MNDAEKWSQLKAGDKSALEDIYRTHIQLLFHYGKRFSANEQLVEDCIQDLFSDIWRTRTNLNDTDSIRRYLLTSLRRRVIRQHQRLLKRQAPLEDNTHKFETELAPDERIIQQEKKTERHQQLQRSFQQLSDRQREIIYLKYYAELDYEDICEIMGLQYQSARNLVSAALRALKKHLGFWIGLLSLIG